MWLELGTIPAVFAEPEGSAARLTSDLHVERIEP
jgi:hypothetical protein